MKKNHNFFLNLAFKIAEINIGNTKLNPSVGTIVVKRNSVISSGVTSINGRPHAEYNALNNKINYKNANLYVTLEPCTHTGLTQPCVNIIKKKKIKNVFYCFNDPDKRTFKKAKLILNKDNVNCKKIKYNKYKSFYKSYFSNKKNNLPFTSAKLAISKDYFTINKKEKWLSNHKSRKIGHLLRSKHDCIVSTSKSINKDNSLLNCRINGLNEFKPDLIIIDLELKLKKKLKLNKLNKKRKTFLLTAIKNEKKLSPYKKLGYKIIIVNSLKNKNDFNILFEKIYKYGYGRILFETGLTFLNTLLKKKLLNDLYLFQSNKKIGSDGKNNDTSKYLKMLKLKNILKINLNNDKLYNVRIR